MDLRQAVRKLHRELADKDYNVQVTAHEDDILVRYFESEVSAAEIPDRYEGHRVRKSPWQTARAC